MRPGDVEQLAQAMRPEDAAEVLASCGLERLAAVRRSVEISEVALALDLGGELGALFGVAPCRRAEVLGPAQGVAWALTTSSVRKHPRAFWRASQDALAALLEHYPVLLNAIDARYSAALRWAARLGGEVQPAEPFGASGLPFHPVIWRSSWATR